MDRAQLALLALVCGCGGPPRSGSGSPVAQPGSRAPTGLAQAAVHARGVLGYAAIELEGTVVSVELGERFALVLRRPGAAAQSIDLGPADYDVDDLAVDRDRRQVWVASADGSVRGFGLATGEELARYQLGQRATAVAAVGAHVATGSAAGVLCLRRRADGALLQCVVAHGAAVSSIDIAPGGATLVTTSHDGDAAVWSLPALAVVARARVGGSANRARFAPGGGAIAVGTSSAPPRRSPEVAARERAGRAGDPEAALVIWKPGAAPRRCRGHRDAIVSVAWTADGEHLISGSWDRTIRLWRSADCQELARLGPLAGIVRSIDIAPGAGHALIATWIEDLEAGAILGVDVLYPD